MEFIKKHWKKILIGVLIIAGIIWYANDQKKKRYDIALQDAKHKAAQYLSGKLTADPNGIAIMMQMLQNIKDSIDTTSAQKDEATRLMAELKSLKQ